MRGFLSSRNRNPLRGTTSSMPVTGMSREAVKCWEHSDLRHQSPGGGLSTSGRRFSNVGLSHLKGWINHTGPHPQASRTLWVQGGAQDVLCLTSVQGCRRRRRFRDHILRPTDSGPDNLRMRGAGWSPAPADLGGEGVTYLPLCKGSGGNCKLKRFLQKAVSKS